MNKTRRGFLASLALLPLPSWLIGRVIGKKLCQTEQSLSTGDPDPIPSSSSPATDDPAPFKFRLGQRVRLRGELSVGRIIARMEWLQEKDKPPEEPWYWIGPIEGDPVSLGSSISSCSSDLSWVEVLESEIEAVSVVSGTGGHVEVGGVRINVKNWHIDYK